MCAISKVPTVLVNPESLNLKKKHFQAWKVQITYFLQKTYIFTKNIYYSDCDYCYHAKLLMTLPFRDYSVLKFVLKMFFENCEP